MAAAHNIKIFLASPSDTAPARAQVAEVVDEINADPLWRKNVHIELLRWDDTTRPVPCSFLRNPQRDVIDVTGDPAGCDLVVALFRHEFGSPLPQDEYGLSPDGDAWTGTQWELHRAVDAARSSAVRDVLVFRDTTTFQLPVGLSREDRLDRSAQFESVERFFEACREVGTKEILRGYNEHDGLNDFEEKVKPMLKAWLDVELKRRNPQLNSQFDAPGKSTISGESLTPAQQQLHDILLTHDQPLDDDLIADAWESDVRGLRGYFLRRFAAWCLPAHGQLDTRFVNLDLLVDRGASSDGERWETRQRYPSLQAMLAEHPGAGAWVLVGDPGGGKSTLLQHHELRAARAALRALAEGQARPELCVWQRLADCPHDVADPQAWLNAQWQDLYNDLPSLTDLAKTFRLRYLLDGVNEIQAPDAAAYRAAVRRWATWAARLAQTAGAHHAPPIFSVRTLEYSEPLSSPTLQVEQARLDPWSAEQMERYCTLSLGPDNALWPHISADPRLRDLCALPFNLNAQCDLTRALGRPAEDRAQLFSGLAWLRLRRAFERHELDAPGLLGDDDRRQLNDSAFWREHLTELPEEGSLVPGLARQAEAMHRTGQGTEVSLPKKAVAPWFDTPAERSAWLKAAETLNLAEVELSGRFRYTHQLWQEYFAARQVRNLPAEFDAELPDLSPPELEPLDEVLRRLAAKDPLPGPGVCGWEEAVKLAVQLSDVPERWVAALRPVNLPLAGRAARLCMDRLQVAPGGVALLDALRQELLQRSRNAEVDLRLRIEAAEALGWIDDPRYEEGRGPGPERHRYRILKPAHWARIPGGPYRIGTDGGASDEQPVTEVTLEAFEMAFAPVTNAEYRCFIEAGGYETDEWWDEGQAQLWRREGVRNEVSLEEWRTWISALREDFDRAVQQYFRYETQAYVEGDLRTYADWTEAEMDANLEESFGAQPHREPAQWKDLAFNQPTQPVVGVCLYEARAYCRWLAAQTGRPMRLPTEAEWEAAARGPDARRWPWGEVDPEPGQINDDVAHLRRTSPVGVFPGSDTAEGLSDLSGNVWEWTSSLYTEELDLEVLMSQASDSTALRAVRGGSWLFRTGDCRAGYRYRYSPDARDGNRGFCVVCCPIPVP